MVKVLKETWLGLKENTVLSCYITINNYNHWCKTIIYVK